MFREENITKIILSSSVLLVTLLTLSLGVLILEDKQHHLEGDLERIEQAFISQQKTFLKETVTQQGERFVSLRALIRTQLKEKLKTRVLMAQTIASNLYQKNKESKARQQFKP